ncbi:receptor-like protein 50 isoform X3 [Silene latifolia]|uniref:receptor-like protein 50 isoform X3 n=1 Tax=Silene latifolia TaxID=37657 RepID=UPI003D77B642
MNRHYQNIRKPRATLLILGCLVMSLCTSCSVGKSNDVYRKNITCIDQERDALLKFKHHIDSDSCRLVASWGNPHTPDCCTWEGVTCSNQSGHVIGLHLGGDPYLNVCLDSSVYSLYSLGELKRLTYLDLSGNLLSSIIPDAIENLQSLMYLDLSYNSLSGNPGLPVNELWHICKTAGNLSSEENVGGDDQHEKDKINIGLYVSIGLGFYTGFWAFCGTLAVKNSWRHVYFQFLDRMIYKIYVIVTVNLARFGRNSEV